MVNILTNSTLNDEFFMKGGGRAGEAMRLQNWILHPLGCTSTWPNELRFTISMMLNTRHPMVLFWDKEGYVLWNDAFGEAVGPANKQWVQGRRANEAWPSVWHEVGQQVSDIMKTGIATKREDRCVPLWRDGRFEEAYWNYSCGPIDMHTHLSHADTDHVGGVLVLCEEVKKKIVKGPQRLRKSACRCKVLSKKRVLMNTLQSSKTVLEPDSDKRDMRDHPVCEKGNHTQQEQVKGAILRSSLHFKKALESPPHGLSVNDHLSGKGSEERVNVVEPKQHMKRRVLISAALSRSNKERGLLSATLKEQVEASAAELERTWRNSHDIITAINLSGTILAMNQTFKSTMGWQSEEVIGHHIIEFIHPDDVEKMLDMRLIADCDAQPKEFINRFRHQDGSYRSLSWSSIVNEGVIYSHAHDITFEIRQSESLHEVSDALRQSQKMESVGQLTGGIAHDFNNLLMCIGGSLQLMSSKVEQGRIDEVEKYAAAAQASVKRAAALTHRLLAFSRCQPVDPKAVDVNRLVASMEDLIRRAVGPRIEMSHQSESNLWSVLVDPNQLENALLNLCINARDAMPQGGRLIIQTTNHWVEEARQEEGELKPGQYLKICVSDNGTGMDPEVAAKAFQPFFTTKPTGIGTGLGLSMIHDFVCQAGGQVEIDSQPGNGTRVCMLLPRHFEQEEVCIPAQPDFTVNECKTAHSETVMVVEDELIIRSLIKEVLEEEGYRVLEAVDAKSALEQLKTEIQVDLLLTDVGLPGGMDGRQLAHAARQEHEGLKVLFVTGYGEGSMMRGLPMEAGMDVLTKPFKIEELSEKIELMVHRE